MENGTNCDDHLSLHIAELKEEIATLKAKLHEKEKRVEGHIPEIKEMIEEGFEKVSDAVRPFAKEAEHAIAEPTKEIMSLIEERINARPFTAMLVALGAGFVIGRLLDVTTRYPYGDRTR